MRPEQYQDISRSKNIDQYSRFFEPTENTKRNKSKKLVGKETRTANIIRSDILGYLLAGDVVREFKIEGQYPLAEFCEDSYQQELNLTDSLGGETRNYVFGHKFEYTQTQDIHEHIEQPKKKGFFRR